jgi:hypothetical protein
LKANKVNLFVSSVFFVFWYHSPNVLDTLHICNISWLRVKYIRENPKFSKRIDITYVTVPDIFHFQNIPNLSKSEQTCYNRSHRVTLQHISSVLPNRSGQSSSNCDRSTGPLTHSVQWIPLVRVSNLVQATIIFRLFHPIKGKYLEGFQYSVLPKILQFNVHKS